MRNPTRPAAPFLFTVTLIVSLFMIAPMLLSVMAGLVNNYSAGLKSGLTLRWLEEVWAVYGGTVGWSLLLALAFVLPLLFWFAMIGFVVYVHHTHVKVSWHDDRAAWQRAQPFVSTTVHLTFPLKIGSLMHHIMEHTAHHVDMSIPLYKLKAAQARIEELLPGRIVIQRFSWRWYFDTARRCKLYDFTQRCWTDFKGRATSEPQPMPAG